MPCQCANIDERYACLNCHFTWHGSESTCRVCGSSGNTVIMLESAESEAKKYLINRTLRHVPPEQLLAHAVTYEFHYGKRASDIVFLMTTALNSDYWFIQWAGSRWSRKEQIFIYEPPAFERDKAFIEETRFASAEEAFQFLNSCNPLAIHRDNLKRNGVK